MQNRKLSAPIRWAVKLNFGCIEWKCEDESCFEIDGKTDCFKRPFSNLFELLNWVEDRYGKKFRAQVEKIQPTERWQGKLKNSIDGPEIL